MDIPDGYERRLYEWTLTGRGEIPLSAEIVETHPDELRKLIWFGVRSLVDGTGDNLPPSDALTWKEIRRRTSAPVHRTTVALDEADVIEAKALGLNISRISRDALRRVIAANTKGAA